MSKTLRQLGYPEKLYIYVVLFVGTLIGMLYVTETRLPQGGRPPYLFLVWNTFLAWIPAGLALVMDGVSLLHAKRLKWLLYCITGGLWLFFYPNAAYLITDLLHPFARLDTEGTSLFWQDMLFWDHLFTVLFTAILGLMLGTISLASIHRLVEKSYGRIAGICFAAVVLGLGSFGVYLGRFFRFNSWDVLRHPLRMVTEILSYFTDMEHVAHAYSYCMWIFLITSFWYLIFCLFGAMNRRMTRGGDQTFESQREASGTISYPRK